MPQPDSLFLEHILQSLDRIEELLARISREEFDRDWVVQDALIRELEIIGEAAGRISLGPTPRSHGRRSPVSATSSSTTTSPWTWRSCGGLERRRLPICGHGLRGRWKG